MQLDLEEAEGQERKMTGEEAGCAHLRPHSCLPHGHAVLALAALRGCGLGPGAVPLPGPGQGPVAQLLGTRHLSALHPFSTGPRTRGPFCHHPPKGKARVMGTNEKSITMSNELGSPLTTLSLNSSPDLFQGGTKVYARKTVHKTWYLPHSCR